MPQLNYRLHPDGMVLPAWIGVSEAEAHQWVQSGKPIPAPVSVRALIDPGSDRTAVAPQVIQLLGLGVFVFGRAQTAGGTFRVNLFRASLTISGASQSSGPRLYLADLLVSEL